MQCGRGQPPLVSARHGRKSDIAGRESWRKPIVPADMWRRLAHPPRFAIVRPLLPRGLCSYGSIDDSHYVHGSMDISAHKRGYAAFLTGVKWTLVLILGIMVVPRHFPDP